MKLTLGNQEIEITEGQAINDHKEDFLILAGVK